MVVRTKSINLFLMDGKATGRVKCSLANWTGFAYKIPRTEIEKCKTREDLKQSGVYFLFGISDDTGENIAYIGQAGSRKNGEGILYRLQEHKRDSNKDYWTEAVVFTTSNNSFGPTEISYLENRFFYLAKSANRYIVKNNIEPSYGHVTEEKESELEEFIEYAEIVMGTLGHRVFDSIEEISDSKIKNEDDMLTDDEPLLFLNSSKASAKGKRSNEGFIVYKDSQLADNPVKSCPNYIINLREKYKSKLNGHILKEDILFSSPSAASSFVKYASTNGLIEWKDYQGRTLKELELNED